MCGNSFRDIAESGRFGCAECYETFYDKVLPSIERIHGQTKHVGKRANKENKDTHYITDTEDLKQQLDKAVEEQNYELAAELRDKIKEKVNKKDGEEKTDE
jgi:protein arginine kinase activator